MANCAGLIGSISNQRVQQAARSAGGGRESLVFDGGVRLKGSNLIERRGLQAVGPVCAAADAQTVSRKAIREGVSVVRVRLAAVTASAVLVLALVSGCTRAPDAKGPASSPVTRKSSASRAPDPLRGRTSEGVVLGPGSKPVHPQDAAPRLFREHPSLRRVLETQVPVAIATPSDAARGAHLIVAIGVVGASDNGTSVAIYADLWFKWFVLRDGKPASGGSIGVNPARINLRRVGETFEVTSVDEPAYGSEYGTSMGRIMPEWAARLVDRNRDPLEAAVGHRATIWALGRSRY